MGELLVDHLVPVAGPGTFNSSSGASPSGRGDGGAPLGCDPTCAAAKGTCNGGVCAIAENPGGLDPQTQNQLQTGGSADSSFKWLYPYDRTVFPRGLVSPTMQFGATSADAAYVRIKSTTVDYAGYVAVTQSPIAFSIPQKSWDAIAAAALGTDPIEVDVTESAGGKVTGPAKESWTIASGRLQGIVYHETYNSPLAGAVGIMQIRIGDTRPTVFKSGCGNVCHSASADGSTLVSDVSLNGSVSYDLKNNGAVLDMQSDSSFAYGGLYPDGSLLMSSTDYLGSFTPSSHLYDTKTGATIAAAGWDGTITRGGTTAFSPDGKRLAFVHMDKDTGHSIAVLPVAVGGYFWTIFTSHRAYGNILASKASSDTLGKLWIAAVDINPSPGKDPSHPAFYLDGQELNADNLRGFLTLPPCAAAGASCTSGDQCCGGYCGQVSGSLQCTSKPPPCSNELDKCATNADCCDTGDLCINNRCAQPPPTK